MLQFIKLIIPCLLICSCAGNSVRTYVYEMTSPESSRFPGRLFSTTISLDNNGKFVASYDLMIVEWLEDGSENDEQTPHFASGTYHIIDNKITLDFDERHMSIGVGDDGYIDTAGKYGESSITFFDPRHKKYIIFQLAPN